MVKTLIFILIVSFVLLSTGTIRYRFKVKDISKAYDTLSKFEDHVIISNSENDYEVEVFAHNDEFIKMDKDFELIEREESRPFAQIQEKNRRNFKAPPPPGYDSPEVIYEKIKKIESQYNYLVKIIDLTKTYNTPLTHQNRTIYAVKISKNVHIDDFALPNRLIVANHHARELITPQIALRTIEKLSTEYLTNPAIKKIVDENQI